MKTIHLTNIVWDTDGEAPEKLDLPSEGRYQMPDDFTDLDVEELTEVLSDRYGYLLIGYRYEVI
jgi:hypothetical protein